MIYENKICKKHGLCKFGKHKKLSWRCIKCKHEVQIKSIRNHKKVLVNLHGNSCKRCGYNKIIDCLDFHHINKLDKEFGIAAVSKSLEAKIKEAEKCILVCKNCHAEIESESIQYKESPYSSKNYEIKCCKKHGNSKFKFSTTDSKGNKRWRCIRCAGESGIKCKRKRKLKTLEKFGNCCKICKYNKNIKALQFHHLEPKNKTINITSSQFCGDKFRNDIDNCILLCANCHFEIEYCIRMLNELEKSRPNISTIESNESSWGFRFNSWLGLAAFG